MGILENSRHICCKISCVCNRCNYMKYYIPTVIYTTIETHLDVFYSPYNFLLWILITIIYTPSFYPYFARLRRGNWVSSIIASITTNFSLICTLFIFGFLVTISLAFFMHFLQIWHLTTQRIYRKYLHTGECGKCSHVTVYWNGIAYHWMAIRRRHEGATHGKDSTAPIQQSV